MAKNNLKILVMGAGSIGQRHIKNLKTLGVEHIGVVDPVLGLPSYSLKEALKEKWDAVFICSPSSTHLKIALEVAKTKTPMFIEKPLSHTLAGLIQLQGISKNIKPIMVGYNIDFHPQFKKIQSILRKKILGKVLGVRAEFGYYLPDWRPGTDYAKSYSAKKDLGGGILLDDIHEINLVYNLFGPVKKTFGLTKKQSSLKIDTEDYVEMILQFENGMIGQVHMDYLQRSYSRSLKVIGEKGTLIWDLNESKIELYTAISKQWKTVDKIAKLDWNETYLAEIKEFLSCLKANKNPESDLIRGIETLKIALAVRDSAKVWKL
ncbi:MAG: Gfo/Idh/MocA family oxidoreductase [bacterium]|nr:Gfo/Idh/MocA family oxidoreductase [bacterium]